MGYPNGYQYTDQATGISYAWDGQQWLQEDGSQPLAYRTDQQPPAAPQSAGYSAPPPYQQQYPQPYTQNVGPAYVTDRRSKNIQATIAWILAILTLGYMLPWAIAATRGKSNTGMIGILNLLLGWTLIGWVAALVMACSAHQIAAAAPNISVVTAVGLQNTYPGAPNYPQPGWTPNSQTAPPSTVYSSAAQPALSDAPFNEEVPYSGTPELPRPAHEA